MAALDWSTPHTALDAAIATTVGRLAAQGQEIADRLERAGEAYDTRYAGAGVAAAKTAWEALLTAALDRKSVV